MADLRVPGDAIPPMVAHLAAAPALAGARVAYEMPDPNGPDPWRVDADPEVPLFVVSDDTGPTIWPILSTPLVRITAYAKGKQTAKLWRRKAMGVVMAGPVAGLAHIDRTGLGYVDTFDPNSGADMASFTVTATVRTEVITV